MPSRRKRKRGRRPEARRGDRGIPLGGWGDPSLGDLVLLRRAVREGWPVQPATAGHIVEALGSLIDSARPRLLISIGKTFVAIVAVNMAAEAAAERLLRRRRAIG
jgi:hypothetical protein